MSIVGRGLLRGVVGPVRERADYALQVADYYGVPVQVTSGYRSFAEQAELRRKYLAGQSRFPANVPGDSAHNYGLAFDSWVPPEYQQFWDYVRGALGFKLYSNDVVHAEVPNWRGLVG